MKVDGQIAFYMDFHRSLRPVDSCFSNNRSSISPYN